MPVTCEEFIDSLSASGLLSAEESVSFLNHLPPERRPTDGRALAKELVRHKKITRYQAQAVYLGQTDELQFDEYLVLDKLGSGGMGEVFKAEHQATQQIVALKVLSAAVLNNKTAVRRFRREVKTVARLDHPNVVAAHDAGEDNGMAYLVMEYVQGRDLKSLVEEDGPLPVATARTIVVQAARGLAYAHDEGVIHRDIKPANLLLDRTGTVKLLDMGLARIRAPEGEDTATGLSSGRLTHPGQTLGTIHYMAPEQADDTHQADARADVYSLGCTLHYMLTGRPPYTGETGSVVMLAHHESPVPPLRERRPDVPETFETVFRRMLAKRPEDRFQSMTEVMDAFAEIDLTDFPQAAPAVVFATPEKQSSQSSDATTADSAEGADLQGTVIESSSGQSPQPEQFPGQAPSRTQLGDATIGESSASDEQAGLRQTERSQESARHGGSEPDSGSTQSDTDPTVADD